MTKEDFCCEAVKEAVSGAQGAVRKRIKENGVTRDSHREQEKKAMAQEWFQIENIAISSICEIMFVYIFCINIRKCSRFGNHRFRRKRLTTQKLGSWISGTNAWTGT